MEVRPAKKEDWPFLIELNKGHSFPFPDFKNMLDVLVVEDNGKVVAWAYSKKYVEIVFVPDADGPKVTKVKSLKLLSNKCIELCKARGIDQVHCYITNNESYAKILVKHFNWGVCSGTPLYLNIDDNG